MFRGQGGGLSRRWERTWWSTAESGDFVTEALEATGGVGVDVMLDVVGGDYVKRNLKACRVGGSILQVGIMDGATAEVPLGLLLTRRIHWVGTVLRGRPTEEKIAVSRRCDHDLVPLFEIGVLRPVIDSSYALEEVADAHATWRRTPTSARCC